MGTIPLIAPSILNCYLIASLSESENNCKVQPRLSGVLFLIFSFLPSWMWHLSLPFDTLEFTQQWQTFNAESVPLLKWRSFPGSNSSDVSLRLLWLCLKSCTLSISPGQACGASQHWNFPFQGHTPKMALIPLLGCLPDTAQYYLLFMVP